MNPKNFLSFLFGRSPSYCNSPGFLAAIGSTYKMWWQAWKLYCNPLHACSVHAGGQPLHVYNEATLVIDLGGAFLILHAFMVAHPAANSHLLGMDHQVGDPWPGGCSYQMILEGEWIEDQSVNLVWDVDLAAGYGLMAIATSSIRQDRDPIWVGGISGSPDFTWKFVDFGVVIAQSTIDTRSSSFPVKMANLGDQAVQLHKE